MNKQEEIEAAKLELSAARKDNDMVELDKAYNKIEKLKEQNDG